MSILNSNSIRLRQTIALVSGGLSREIEKFWRHPQLKSFYPEFLFALHGIVSASTPLMDYGARVAEKMATTQEGENSLAASLATYLREHAAEESGHDKWILEDMESLGCDSRRVTQRIAYASVTTIVGAQYYWTTHYSPVAILGYLAVLENPAAPEFLEHVAKTTGIPLNAMSTMLRHSRLDVKHVAEFDAMLDNLTLSDSDIDVLFTSAISTVSYLRDFFAEVLSRSERGGEELFIYAVKPQFEAKEVLSA